MAIIEAQDNVALNMIEAAERSRLTGARHKRSYLGMSSIGHPCALRLWMSFRGYATGNTDGKAVMIFDLGDRVEEAVKHWLREAGYKIDGEQTEFTDHNGLFRGHCDGIIHGVTKRPHILEVKSAKAKRFAEYKKHGVQTVSPVYWAQVQCYMGYAGLERAIFVIMNKDNCELYTERVHFLKEDFEALRQKARDIITADIAPDPTADQKNCAWCEYKDMCGGDAYPVQTGGRKCGTCLHLRLNGFDFSCDQGGTFHAATCDAWEYRRAVVDQVPF